MELAAQVAREKLAFQQSLSRFQEKGKALKAALDAARASAAKDTRALMERHQVSFLLVRSSFFVTVHR